MSTLTQPAIISAKAFEETFGDNVDIAVEAVKASYMKYPTAPTKPFLTQKHNSAELAEYSVKFSAYEKAMEAYNAEKKIAQEHNRNADNQLRDYIKEVSGFNRIVPADRKDKVWNKAWSDGHSSGYHEVYTQLSELVDLFV